MQNPALSTLHHRLAVARFCRYIKPPNQPYDYTPMAARSIGSATISFGLVSVPVNLFSSSESSASISFNMLHTTCGSRLKQQYICSKEGTVVEKDERSEEHTSELQSHVNLVCRLLLEKKKKKK